MKLKKVVIGLALAGLMGSAFAVDTVDPLQQTVEQGGSNTGINYGNAVIGFQNTLNGSTLGVVVGRQLNVAAGLQDVVQIGNMGGTQSTGTVGIGTSVYSGPNADYSTLVGAGSSSYAMRGVANGFMASVLSGANDSAAIGSYSTAVEANTVSVGNPTLLRRITFVDTPINATDAANKGYVDSGLAVVDAKAVSAQNTANAANVTAHAADVKASTALAGVDQLQGRIGGLENRINEVDRKASGGIAMALAIAAPVSILPGESAASAGVGTFGGQTGFAMTIAHSIKLDGLAKQETNELGEAIAPPPTPQPWIFKEAIVSAGLGVSSAGDVGARASVTFKW